MNSPYEPIRDLLARVRSRWRRLLLFQAALRAALAATGVLALVLFLTHWTSRAPEALAVLGLAAVVLAIGALVWGFWPAREVPSDRRVARFIEERVPSLDERLVSAVDVAAIENPDDRPALALSMIADADRVASSVDPATVLPTERLRRAGFQAAAAALLLLGVGMTGRDTARQSFDALSLALFPSRVTIDVRPGNVRVEAGRGLTIEARLVGNRAPVVAQLLLAAGESGEWRATEMKSEAGGHFTLALDSISDSFRYKVSAGTVTSSTFDVAVLRAPRVKRIDVEYTYPRALGLEPRVEEDGGDIYAPAGTDVRVRVHTDREAVSGRLLLGGGSAIDLTADGRDRLSGSLQIMEDASYRVALGDADGLTSRGDTEYFIRTLEDRPPDVHVTKPASDRKVTRLEEVDIEAEAQDDFGVESLELVYAVRGGPETRVPLTIPRRATTVTGRRTLYLEDLDVEPGDFVTYYVRARDLARGKRASETRSDIFFLEVKPFDQEFSLAQSQASMGGGSGNRQIDDLVAAQKEIIVATWKLDRRSRAARGAKSEQDIKSVSRAESELKARVEETSSSFRESNMRDPRRRPPTTGRGGQPPPGAPSAGQMLPEEDAMTAAATAMGHAVSALDALKTADALPAEMQALNHLLKAQADVKKRQVQRQQAGAGGGGNRTTQDLSSLFDKELARQQQTNYETPTSTEQREDQTASALDKIKDLARRQDELLKRQQELARDRAAMTEEELRRELETLTRDQNELRKRAEDLAQQMSRQQQSGEQDSKSGQQSQQGQQGQQSQAGQQSQQGQQGQGSQAGRQPSSPGQSGGGQNGRRMRDVSEEMRSAASELRRQDAGQATERGARALEKLRDLERQMQSSSPDARRRALGDLQLEARQLADAQRQIASESNRTGPAGADKDALRRLAGEEDRLADRLRRVREGLEQQAAGGGAPARERAGDSKNSQEAAGEASREVDRQRLTERMQQSADVMRAGGSPGNAGALQEIARALDKVADTLASADGSRDEASRKLSGQLSRAQQLRERLDGLNRELEKLGQQGGQERNGRPAGTQQGNDQPPGIEQPTGRPSGGQQGGSQQGNGQQSGGQNDQSQSAQATPGQGGKSGQGRSGAGGSGTEVVRLREDVNRQMQEVRELMNQLRREDPSFSQGGAGRTFEGQGMTLSAPGTEAFKQDFAKWQELRRQATQALEHAESTLAKRLQEKASKDRLAAGVDDKPPAAYQQQVDSYFKALATRKKP